MFNPHNYADWRVYHPFKAAALEMAAASIFALVMLALSVGVIIKSAEFFGVRAVMVVSER